jgi:NADPH:quinone reductase-like Zn-dependent oxidoreductase
MREGSIESKLLNSPILGRECSGIVREIEQGANGFSIGDDVLAYVGSMGFNGTYTEYISIPQELVAVKPPTISFEEASAIPLVGLTALQYYERLNIQNTHFLFIAGGAGGVGTMLIKLVLCNGIDSFVTTAGSTESKAHLLSLGVKEENIIDHKQADLTQQLLAHNRHQPYEYVIDLVGGSLLKVNSEVVKINGCYADVTNLTTGKVREQLFDKGITVVNISNYAYSLTGISSHLKYYGEKLAFLMNLVKE